MYVLYANGNLCENSKGSNYSLTPLAFMKVKKRGEEKDQHVPSQME